MAAILNSAIMDLFILHKKNFTHSFWLNLMMAAIFNSAILNSAILHKKNFTESFCLNLMMAAILNSAMLDLDTMLSSLRFTQKHFPSTLTLTQTNSIWLTRWWQPSWILPSWIQWFCLNLWFQLIQSDSKSFILTELYDGSHIEFCHLGFSHLHKKKLHSCILTQINDGSHFEFCHLQFSHFPQKNFT